MNRTLATLGRTLLLAAGVGATGMQAYAADPPYPTKPVRIVVGSAPGGVTDIAARVVGAELSKSLGQPFVIENRAGAGGLIGLTNVYKSDRDGYSLLMVPATLPVVKALYHNIDFDPVEDFVPVANIAMGPNAISVNPSFPAKTFKDFIAYAKTHDVSYASCGPGTPQHLAAELLRSVAGLQLTHSPYKGCGAAIIDVLGGSVPVFFSGVPNVIEDRKDGKLIVLAVTSMQRDPMMPDVPTVAESGFPQVDSNEWFGLIAAKGVPPYIIDKLNKAVNAALKTPSVKQKLASLYMEPMGGTPEAFGKLIHDDTKRLGAVVVKAGIQVQ
jgi:tripartite-type tricarboxylate transporter receptor subunit TctC